MPPRPARRAEPAAACPCGRAAAYAACCGRWHAGEPAPDPEALMRSRYSAHVLGLDDYLHDTWHPSTRPPRPARDPTTRWLGLQVRAAVTQDPDRATVEFVARWRGPDGRGHRHHETSRFVRTSGRWWYLDGDLAPGAG